MYVCRADRGASAAPRRTVLQAEEHVGGKQLRTHRICTKSEMPAELKLWLTACPADGRPARARGGPLSGMLLEAHLTEQDCACNRNP